MKKATVRKAKEFALALACAYAFWNAGIYDHTWYLWIPLGTVGYFLMDWYGKFKYEGRTK